MVFFVGMVEALLDTREEVLIAAVLVVRFMTRGDTSFFFISGFCFFEEVDFKESFIVLLV